MKNYHIPTATSLCLLLILVGITASCAARKNGGIEVTTLLQSSESWNGTPLPEYPAEPPEITILKFTIPPGAALKPHWHTVINAGVLLKGKLEVIDEQGNELQLEVGDSLLELVNTVHYGRNVGKSPAEIIVFYAGVPDRPFTILADKDHHP